MTKSANNCQCWIDNLEIVSWNVTFLLLDNFLYYLGKTFCQYCQFCVLVKNSILNDQERTWTLWFIIWKQSHWLVYSFCVPMSLPNLYFIWLMSLLRVSCSLCTYVHSQELQISDIALSLRWIVRCPFIRSRGNTSGTMIIPRLGILLPATNGVARVMFSVVSVHQSVILSRGRVPPYRTLALPLPWTGTHHGLQCISTLYTNYWYGTISIIFA